MTISLLYQYILYFIKEELIIHLNPFIINLLNAENIFKENNITVALLRTIIITHPE